MKTEDLVLTNLQVNKKQRETIFIGAKEDNENQTISQIITGVQNAICHEYGLKGEVIRFTTNGLRTQVYVSNRWRTAEIINDQ